MRKGATNGGVVAPAKVGPKPNDVLAEVDLDRAQRLLELADAGFAEEVRESARPPPGVGRCIHAHRRAVLPVRLTVGEAVERIRQLHDDYEDRSYVYVVDDKHRLLGVVSFRDGAARVTDWTRRWHSIL